MLQWVEYVMIKISQPAALAGGPGFEPQMGISRIFKLGFHQQKPSSLSITCDVKLEGVV